jgi:hypothetical protein
MPGTLQRGRSRGDRTMTTRAFNQRLFQVAALYHGLLGALFFVAPTWPFQYFNIAEPNHPVYVQFPAALFVIFAAMFQKIAREPAQYRHLIPYGIALKAASCVLSFWYWLNPGIPGIWKVFAVIDLVMGLLFLRAYQGDR